MYRKKSTIVNVSIAAISFVGCLLGIVGTATLFAYYTEKFKCESRYEGFEKRFSLWGGCECQLKTGEWIPVNSLLIHSEEIRGESPQENSE